MRITNTAIQINEQAYLLRNISSVSVDSTGLTERVAAEEFEDYMSRYQKWLSDKKKKVIRSVISFTVLLLLLGPTIGIILLPLWDSFLSSNLEESLLPLHEAILETMDEAGLIRYFLPIVGFAMIVLAWSAWRVDVNRRSKPPEQRMKYDDVWCLNILSNSGQNSLLHSRDKPFLVKLQDIILKAIDASDQQKPINYNVNVEKQEIVQSTVNVDQSTNTTIYDYSVDYNNYEGITADQLSFLTGAFQSTLEQFMREMQSGTAETAQASQELLAALKEKEPDKSKIASCWSALKTVTDACDVSSSLWGMMTAGLTTLGIAV